MERWWMMNQKNMGPWRRQWHPTPVLLPGKSHGWRSWVGCSPWGREESDATERLHFQFSLSCTGEGNGNRLRCSCLENPRDDGAWWAAVSGVAQSRPRLKRLSSSSSPSIGSVELESCEQKSMKSLVHVWWLKVNSVRFVIPEEENLDWGPGTRLDHSRAFV